MSISRKRAQDYAEKLLERPRGQVLVTVRRTKTGVTLLHKGRALTRCHASAVGVRQAKAMAAALGVQLPAGEGSVQTTVSSGVLHRAIALSSLDLMKPEGLQVMRHLLELAVSQRRMESIES
ncbi:MAG: hypothetical protein HYX97_05675 [Chloroflexi bacterium]|nr:hypothetical protein [Chloroflexota bacterium]